jgi:NAD(P)H-hydrate epimerase
MAGAVAMSGMAALRSGAGLVTVATADRALDTVAQFHPALMTLGLPDISSGELIAQAAAPLLEFVRRVDVVACGPGLGTGDGPRAIVAGLCAAARIPLVLDADGLNTLASLAPWEPLLGQRSTVITPHPGEFARLSGVSADDRTAQRRAAATLVQQILGLVIVLKGAPTSVFADKREWINETGNPAMATAGAGDVLTGVIAALIGQGLSPVDAARLGVYVHGLAGDLAAKEIGPRGVVATDLIERLPRALQTCERS